jgi:ferredoxin--NADP+ reductase
VHVFGRRGPAQIKFTPLELRELSHSKDVDIVLYPEDFEFDEASEDAIRNNNQTKTMVNTLTNWLVEEHAEAEEPSSRRLHLHFLHSPVEIEGDSEGKVTGIKFERMQLDGTGNVKGTGDYVDYPVQAVYRAIGYHGSPLDELEYDARRGVIPNEGGRVLDATGKPVPGIYTTGWIKRGPVGLIGHTKGDALETIGFLLEDRLSLPPAENPSPQAIIDLLEERGIEYTTWEGWNKLDAHEAALGAEWSQANKETGIVRERVKVVPREEMIDISRAAAAGAAKTPAEGTAKRQAE